jgi:hypothetical protein
VRVVRAYKVDRMALHALEPYPDIGLDVFHDVADVEVTVGVGQGGGDEELAGHGEIDFHRGTGDFSRGLPLESFACPKGEKI